MCNGCHNIRGYQASFPEVYKVPMIAGQNAKYIVAALTAYRKGERKHPTMRAHRRHRSPTRTSPTSPPTIEQLGKAAAGAAAEQADAAAAPPPRRSPSLLDARRNCASCHGANFSKPIDPDVSRSSPASTPTTCTPR